MKVLGSGDQVLVNPWIVSVLHTMLLTDFTHCRSNIRVPSRTHTWEQVMFHLKVQSTAQPTRNVSSIRRRSLNLGLEPADRFSGFPSFVGRITIRIFKVVGKCKQDRQGKRFGNSHYQNVCHYLQRKSLVPNGSHNVTGNVEKTQKYSVLAALLHIITFHLNTNGQSSTLSQVQNLRIKDRRDPVSSQYKKIVESLEFVKRGTPWVIRGIIIEQQHWFRTKSIGIFDMVIGVSVVLQRKKKRKDMRLIQFMQT